jgi:hypothetical protein
VEKEPMEAGDDQLAILSKALGTALSIYGGHDSDQQQRKGGASHINQNWSGLPLLKVRVEILCRSAALKNAPSRCNNSFFAMLMWRNG